MAMMICIFISSSLFAGDIYVNGDQAVYGDGTISNPYKSISSAITAAQSCTTATTIQETDVPATLVLGVENYPNPFNPSTTISYCVPADGDVTLTIYNARGQMVNTLVSAPKAKGNYQVVWQGKDSNGNTVASGLYFTSLVSGGKSISKKMLLMK